jgi:hypothetical protein
MYHRSVKSGRFAILNPCTRKNTTRVRVPEAGKTERFWRWQPVYKSRKSLTAEVKPPK